MAVKIRLKKLGRKKKPYYRIVVADSRSPRDGEVLETVGRYDPTVSPSLLTVDDERVKYWLGVGAQPTRPLERLLASKSLMENVTRKSSNLGVSRKELKKSENN